MDEDQYIFLIASVIFQFVEQKKIILKACYYMNTFCS